MDLGLEGRTALVTGSTGGIGVGIAQALARSGVSVIVTGRDHQRGDEVVRGLAGEGGRATFVAADLTAGADAISSLAAEALEAADGRLDILVNNAAMLLMPAPTAAVDAGTIAAAFATSVGAPFLLTGLLAPAMAERGWGAVVNIGSINGVVGMSHSALYSSTKAALHSLTKSWAAEFGPSGVRVNTVAPGPTATDRNRAFADHPEFAKRMAPIMDRIPSGRMSTLDEVGAAVVFLASDQAANIHGATLAVDGGFSAVS